jgi:hypothetical protein
MKKSLWTLCTGLLFFAACTSKTYPSKPVAVHTSPSPVRIPNTIIATPVTTPNVISNPVPAVSSVTSTAKIIVDGYGKILTPQDKLPQDENIKPDYTKLARSFTPGELTNLRYRYHTVPPRVLYIPRRYIIQSQKGNYCVYKKKFWYWQKADGLFYLDETYYK